MYYHERGPDGTVVGLFDGTRDSRAIPEAAFWAHHEAVAQAQHPKARGHVFPPSTNNFPLRAIQHARIRTALITTYRIHSGKYIFSGQDFPKTFAARAEKIQAQERYSPPGTLGYYFGLTLDAAFDEGSFYAGKDVEREGDESKLILVHRTHYSDLLYLAPVLPALWEHLRLPDMPMWEMYISVMAPNTGNKITNTIGEWAREFGFRGIVFPSARYGQRVEPEQRSSSGIRFPVLNFLDIGSHLCEQGVAIQLTLNALISGLTRHGAQPLIVYSEPNLVIFDEAAVAGLDRPVFYTTYRLQDAAALRDRDERHQLKHSILYARDESRVLLFVDGPAYRYFLEAPREP